jgi:hypothetical protein
LTGPLSWALVSVQGQGEGSVNKPNQPGKDDRADRIIDRVAAESDVTGGTWRNPAERNRGGDEDDWIERTGKRIGRALGLIVFAGLVIWLASSLFGNQP